ncbi:MAG TPA: aspartate--tRNA(Asn) ligase [Candidatus Paceibacterota bacterium]|jgi:nondiscriminating aspartyl-tRNA synthetase
MNRIIIADLHEHVDQTVTIAGWVDGRRDHGKLIFLDIRDRSGTLQTVALPQHDGAHKIANLVRPEWVLRLTGFVKKRPDKMVNANVPTGDIEMEITDIAVLSEAEELPFLKDSELNLDTLLDYRPFTMRRARDRAVFKVQHEIVRAYREALVGEGFIEFQPPKIVGGDAEGGAGAFKLEYFNDKLAYLATSPQLYKQIAVGAFERVFSVGNVFRAEKHSTTRHLNEYTSLDAEMGFIKDHTDVMKVLTQVLGHITKQVAHVCASELSALGAEAPQCPSEFPAMKLREAQELIKARTGEDCTSEKDLTPEHERWLSSHAKEAFNSDFMFVTHFPVEKAAFYAYDDPDDSGFTRYFDLLFRGVELVSGGQRTHEYAALVAKMRSKGLDPDTFSFYLQAFRYGMPPHGGWGMGLERLTQKYLGLDNVKEAALFPREINRIDTLLS